MKNNKNSKKCISLFAIICLVVALFSVTVYFVAAQNSVFAETISIKIGNPFRFILAKITGILPFSLAEILIILSPFIIFFAIFFAARQSGTKNKIRYFVSVLSVISLILSGYVFTLGVGYYRKPTYEKIGLESNNPTKDELYKTLIILKSECESLLDEIEFSESGSSICPITFDEVCEDVCLGYERVSEKYPELQLQTFDSKAKPVHFSKFMTYLDILGIYTFFTGESNVNVHYPDYCTPSTIAHEFAHQRGIARENEANFTAFLVCINSDNPYVRYSGYMNMFEYVASALGKSDRELWYSIYNETDERLRCELKANSDFYLKNRSELLGKISDFFNDNYLKLQGNDGIVSYSMVVKLCVSYYCNE